MSNITIIDYKEAIKYQYEIAKKEDVLGILSDPTPAQLRDSYIRIFDKGLTGADEEIMKTFFETKENESLKKSIENCNIGKLKPIIHFLKGIKNTENRARIELAAILVDFNQRPYQKYSKNDEVVIIEKPKEEEGNKGKVVVSPPKKDPENPKKNKPSFIDWMCNTNTRLIATIAVLMISVFGITKYAVDDKECMQWQEDHFELVYCETNPDDSTNGNPKIPIDKELLDLRKIKITDTTTFFKNGKPIVWYCKTGDEFECFNEPGFHPLNNKSLKPITNHMIDKYAYK